MTFRLWRCFILATLGIEKRCWNVYFPTILTDPIYSEMEEIPEECFLIRRSENIQLTLIPLMAGIKLFV